MKYFIVYAHYEPQSFCGALLHHSVKVLQELGHEVKVSNLYEMHFNPVASQADFANPKPYCQYAIEQRHGYEGHTLAGDIMDELEKLLWADVLILHFPLFWFSMPAILKGWIDRVFISGLCYGGKRFYNRGGLGGKRASLTITLGARETMFGENGLHGPLHDMLAPIMRGSLYYVGMQVIPPFCAYHVPYITNQQRGAIIGQYDEYLKNYDRLEPLKFPTIDDNSTF